MKILKSSRRPASAGRALALAALLLTAAVAQTNPSGSTRILTVAGGGYATNTPAKAAPVVRPSAVALDPLGRGFYVVDEVAETSLLRFVNTTGRPVTLAGTTVEPGAINLIAGGGSRIEDGAARDVDLSLLAGLVADPTGNAVYFVSPVTSGLRALNVSTQPFNVLGRLLAPGQVTTVFQPSRTDFRSLVLDPQAGAFYYIATAARSSLRVVYRVDATLNEAVYAGGGDPGMSTNGDGGPAVGARLVSPMALAVDSQGNVLIAEGGDSRGIPPGAVRRVDTGGTISTLADNLEFPTGIAVAPDDTAYVALGNRQQVLRLRPNGSRSIVAGDNSAAACDLISNPTCGDGGPALSASFSMPGSTDQRTLVMAADEAGLLIPDLRYRRVRYVNLGASPVTVAGTPIDPLHVDSVVGSGAPPPYDNSPATAAELQAPLGVASDAEGNLYISDSGRGRLRFVNRTAGPITLFAGTPSEQIVQPGDIVSLNNQPGQAPQDDRMSTATFFTPQGLAVALNGIFVVDSQGGRLYPVLSPQGRRTGLVRFINTSAADVTLFGGIVVPPGQIRDVAGVRPNVTPSGIGDGGPATRAVIFPTDVALDPAGNLYIADQGNNLIRKVDALTGTITSLKAQEGDEVKDLKTDGATGIAFDSSGRLYIADTRKNRVLRQDAPGGLAFTTIANATLGLDRPRDLTVDASGLVYVTNTGTHEVLRISAPANTLGTVQVIAGTGQAGFSGDGGAAKQARLNLHNPGEAPNDVQVTANIVTLPNGDRAFTDTLNNRVRLLVQSANAAPALAPAGNQSLDEGARLTLAFAAADADGDALTFSLTGKPAFGTFTDNGNGTASLTLAPGFSDAGAYNLTLTVSDGDLSDTRSFTLTINDVSPSPGGCVGTVAAGRWRGEYFNNVSLGGEPVMVRDDGDGPLDLNWIFGGPSSTCGLGVDLFSARWTREVNFEGGNYRFTVRRDDGVRLYIDGVLKLDRWEPAVGTSHSVDIQLAAGSHVLVVEYFENTRAARVKLTWQKDAPQPGENRAPVIDQISNQTASSGQTVNTAITFRDPDGDPVSLSLQNAPRFVSLVNVGPGSATLRVAPLGPGDQGSFVGVTVRAEDGRGGVAQSNPFSVTVAPQANRPPLAFAGPLPGTIVAPDDRGALVRLSGNASSDPDGDPLTFSWTDNGAVIATAAVAEVRLAVGSHSIVLTVSDGRGGTRSAGPQLVNVTAPAPLTVRSINPSSGKRGETLTAIVNGTAFQQGASVRVEGDFVFADTDFISGTQLRVRIVVSVRATLGARSITVTNPNGASATLPHAFTVEQ